jgi:hypothetical protein
MTVVLLLVLANSVLAASTGPTVQNGASGSLPTEEPNNLLPDRLALAPVGLTADDDTLLQPDNDRQWLYSVDTASGWNDLSSVRFPYDFTEEEASASCDRLSTRKLTSDEVLYAIASWGISSERQQWHIQEDLMTVTPLTVLKPEGFRFTDTQELKFLTELRRIDTGKLIRIEPEPYHTILAIDHCYWSASAPRGDNIPMILTSGSTRSFRVPSQADIALFHRIRPSCFPENANRCPQSTLVAVSDVDGNGLEEFWSTNFYSFAVDELFDHRVIRGKRYDTDLYFVEIASSCQNCD